MNSIDLILIAIVLFSFLIGWKTGMIKVLASIGSLILGYQAARMFSSVLAEKITQAVPALTPTEEKTSMLNYLSLIINTDTIANRIIQVISFIVIFILVCMVVRWLAGLLDRVFRGTFLGSVNGFFGAILSVVVLVLLINFAYVIVLPAFSNVGGLVSVLTYFEGSKMILPFLLGSGGTVFFNLPKIGSEV